MESFGVYGCRGGDAYRLGDLLCVIGNIAAPPSNYGGFVESSVDRRALQHMWIEFALMYVAQLSNWKAPRDLCLWLECPSWNLPNTGQQESNER